MAVGIGAIRSIGKIGSTIGKFANRIMGGGRAGSGAGKFIPPVVNNTNMRVGGFRNPISGMPGLPSIGRIARAAIPAGAIAASPTIAEFGMTAYRGSFGSPLQAMGSFAAAPGSLRRSVSPFANRSPMSSAGNMSTLMRANRGISTRMGGINQGFAFGNRGSVSGFGIRA